MMKKYIEKQSNNSFLLRINVKPNSKKQEIIINGNNLTIKVRSKALQNKANKELLNLLRNKLNISSNQLSILSGIKSTEKIIQILLATEFNEEEVIKKFLT